SASPGAVLLHRTRCSRPYRNSYRLISSGISLEYAACSHERTSGRSCDRAESESGSTRPCRSPDMALGGRCCRFGIRPGDCGTRSELAASQGAAVSLRHVLGPHIQDFGTGDHLSYKTGNIPAFNKNVSTLYKDSSQYV